MKNHQRLLVSHQQYSPEKNGEPDEYHTKLDWHILLKDRLTFGDKCSEEKCIIWTLFGS